MKGVPDLTMVDLPGITRVLVPGQPEDIYEQISKIIMEFIAQEESIILNVLSATVDFSTCESIRMSQRVDKIGQRTLAVVTKADKSPEGPAGEEINVMQENRSIGLPNFSPRAAFLTLLQKKAKEIHHTPFNFVDKIWSYIGEVMDSVLRLHSDFVL
ncbi:UNVERIFIED_CONTAM: Dynamin-related protein 4C [Sesamum angustifolium]|uniref:Dynamin-related protein 4C n=1 Tax=Sesamum angustifolium TaxID=2727405 RepID=A0AAW2MI52_9LAMI